MKAIKTQVETRKGRIEIKGKLIIEIGKGTATFLFENEERLYTLLGHLNFHTRKFYPSSRLEGINLLIKRATRTIREGTPPSLESLFGTTKTVYLCPKGHEIKPENISKSLIWFYCEECGKYYGWGDVNKTIQPLNEG